VIGRLRLVDEAILLRLLAHDRSGQDAQRKHLGVIVQAPRDQSFDTAQIVSLRVVGETEDQVDHRRYTGVPQALSRSQNTEGISAASYGRESLFVERLQPDLQAREVGRR